MWNRYRLGSGDASPVVTMLKCREAKECKTRCQRNRLKRRESVETWEVEVMNVTEHETSDIKKATTQGKVDSKDGKQGRTADLRKPESSTSKAKKAGSAKNGNRRDSANHYSGEGRWSSGEAKMNTVLNRDREDEGARVQWETARGNVGRAEGASGTRHKKRKLSGRRCEGCKEPTAYEHDAKQCKRCKQHLCEKCRKRGCHVCVPGQWCPSCSKSWEQQEGSISVGQLKGGGEVRYCTSMCQWLDKENSKAQLQVNETCCGQDQRQAPSGKEAGADRECPGAQETRPQGAAKAKNGTGARCRDKPEDDPQDRSDLEDFDWDALENGEQQRLHARVNNGAHVGGLHKKMSVGNASLGGPKITRGDVQTAAETETRKRADHRRVSTGAHKDMIAQHEDEDAQDEGTLREKLVQVVHRLRADPDHTRSAGGVSEGSKHAAKRKKKWESLMRSVGFELEEEEGKRESQMKDMESWTRAEVTTWAAASRKQRGEKQWLERDTQGLTQVVFSCMTVNSKEEAQRVLEQAGVSTSQEEWGRMRYSARRERSSKLVTALVTVKVHQNRALRDIMTGDTEIQGHAVGCELIHEEQKHQEEWTTLEPTRAGVDEVLRDWCELWTLMGVREIDIRELILLLTSIQSPSFQAKEVTIWGPSAPRIAAGAWHGVGDGRGQIRIRGCNAPVSIGIRYAVEGVQAIAGREALEKRGKAASTTLWPERESNRSNGKNDGCLEFSDAPRTYHEGLASPWEEQR